MKMKDIMTPCPYHISGDASLDEALSMMTLHGVRHLPVVDDGNMLGVLSERDARLSQLVCSMADKCPPVGELCSDSVPVVQSEDLVACVASDMAEKRIDCCLVADSEGHLVGIFTSTDACRLIYLLLDKDGVCELMTE